MVRSRRKHPAAHSARKSGRGLLPASNPDVAAVPSFRFPSGGSWGGDTADPSAPATEVVARRRRRCRRRRRRGAIHPAPKNGCADAPPDANAMDVVVVVE